MVGATPQGVGGFLKVFDQIRACCQKGIVFSFSERIFVRMNSGVLTSVTYTDSSFCERI